MPDQMLSHLQIAQGFLPVDLSAGANDGDWVSLEQYRRCLVVLYGAAGTAGDDPTLTLEQATSAAGGGAKALTFTDIFRKQAATSLLAVGQYTKTVQAAAGSYTEATAAEQALIWVVEVDARDLDHANGFKFIRGRVADVGTNAQLGALLYVLGEPRYVDAPENLASALA